MIPKRVDIQTVGVIGANGRSGRVCVTSLLEHGFRVRAAVHHSNSLPTHPSLGVFTVDGMNVAEVEKWADGCDALVSMVGHGRHTPQWMQTETIRSVVAACNRHGIRRVISLTGTGVRFPGDRPSVIDRVVNFAVAQIDPQRIADGVKHAELLRQSNLDWTLLRVFTLGNGNVQSYNLSQAAPARLLTTRRTVADAVVTLLNSGEFLRAAPVIVKPSIRRK